MPVLGFKARPIQHDLILTGLHLVNTLFRGSHSQVVGIRALTDLYGRHKSTHTTQDHIHFFPFFFFFFSEIEYKEASELMAGSKVKYYFIELLYTYIFMHAA